MAGPDFAEIPHLIALLDNRTRRVICETLAITPLTSGQLAQYVAVKQPTLSYHTQLLFNARLISRDWETPGYHVSAEKVRLISRYVEEVLMPAGARCRGFP
jgi:predicted transcriptional regulator